MRRNWALAGADRTEPRGGARSVACLAFVVLLSIAFWAGAVWIADILIRLISAHGY